MTSTQYNSGRQLSSLDRIMAIDGRPYETDAITPCRADPARTGQRSVVQPVSRQDPRDSRLQGVPVHWPVRLQRGCQSRTVRRVGWHLTARQRQHPRQPGRRLHLPARPVRASPSHRARRVGGPGDAVNGCAPPPQHPRDGPRRVPTQIPPSPKPAWHESSRRSGVALHRPYRHDPGRVHVAVRDYPADAEEATAVLLHGFCLNQNSWNGQGRRLLRRWGSRMRLITYDHRGHGQSGTAPSHTYRVPTLADDLNSVLAALHVRTPLVLVGHSMGGMTALTFAGRPATDQAVPSYGLVLVATAAGRRLTERGTGRLLAIPAVGVLPALLGHVPDHAAAGPGRSGLHRNQPARRGCAPAARDSLAAAATSAMASTPLTTALGFLPALHDYNAYPSWPPSSRAPSSCPAAPMRSPHRRTPRTWPPASPEQSTYTYPALATCSPTTRPLAITDAIIRASNIPAAPPHSTQPIMALDGA